MHITQQNVTSTLFNKLSTHYGSQNWWPATTPFEMALGAILTQSTNWNNASKALTNLEKRGLLSPSAIDEIPHGRLAIIIRPSGYYNVKAARLKAFANHIYDSYGDDFESYLRRPIDVLRKELLSVKGIGKETADAIILYAGNKAIFIIDEYTKRLFSRIGQGPANKIYDHWQTFFHINVPRITEVYNEYHALIAEHCKTSCNSKPKCDTCFLSGECQTGKQILSQS